MKIPLVDLKAQFTTIEDKLKEAIYSVLSSGEYINGEEVTLLEEEICEYLGAKHCITVGNGTDGLVIALKALGIGPGDEVITSPFTFFASAESISQVGATPVFVDVKKDSFNIDYTKIEEKITEKTKAIMVVHIFGQPADIDNILNVAKLHSLKIIEDSCQAIGAAYKGRKIGTLGDVSCFSFFPTKNLSCTGDGGMIVTDDDNIAAISKALRSHGSGELGKNAYNLSNNIEGDPSVIVNNSCDSNCSKYYHYLVGYNSRLDTLQASILRVKLKFLDYWNNLRRSHADYYNLKLNSTSLILPCELQGCHHAYHMYVLQSEERSKLIDHLNKNEIGTGVYYPVPLHLQIVYKNLGYKEGDLPCAEYLSSRTFAIPIYPELTVEQQDYIINTLLNFNHEI
jgi:dTDP-4-amino-4,6-dideoxygalactose transaminase